MKRQKLFSVLFTDAEWFEFESLQKHYASSGVPVSKASLVRYGLKRLPHQPFPAIPF
jgi:hypothetical protein